MESIIILPLTASIQSMKVFMLLLHSSSPVKKYNFISNLDSNYNCIANYSGY